MGSRKWQTHTHTHTQCRSHTQDGSSLGQDSDAILTHASVAHPLIKLSGYDHREDTVGGGGSRQWQPHTNTRTQCPS